MSTKIEKFTAVEAQKMIADMPNAKKGKWKELLTELHATNQGARVTNLSRGSAYALAKQAREMNMAAATTTIKDPTTKKETTTVIVTAPVKTK